MDMQSCLQNEAAAKGWHIHSSTSNPDAGKCDAITCVISRTPFEEVSEFMDADGKKLRYFACGRHGHVWIMSCHVQGEILTKQQIKDGVPSHGNASRATRIFGQI